MNDEQKKDMTPEQDPVENTAPEEKTAKQAAEDTEKENVTEQDNDAEAAKGEESRDSEKKEKRRFGRKPSKEEEKIAALEKEKADLNDKFLRICAEYDNFRKRSQKEKDALYGDIKANTVTQFCTTLEKMGVTEIKCLGEKFDPTMHNAVMHVDDEEKGENEIVEVFQKGFKLGDKVIRFAMVKVAN